MALQRRRTRVKSRSKGEILSELSNLGEVSLKSETDTYIYLSLLEDVEGILESEELTELEREGFTLIREYLKEATIMELRRAPIKSFQRKIREIASILRIIDNIKEKGAEMITFDDLVVVGEVDGRPIYSIRKGDSPNR